MMMFCYLFEEGKCKHTFIVGRFKELYLEQIKAKINYKTGYARSQNEFVIFSKLNGSFLMEQKVPIGFNSSKWESVTEEIECQLLKLGDGGWQKGRLRVKNYVDFLPEDNRGRSYDSPHGLKS